jgi:succinate dehydrogenase hydrophobic anchor subunit
MGNSLWIAYYFISVLQSVATISLLIFLVTGFVLAWLFVYYIVTDKDYREGHPFKQFKKPLLIVFLSLGVFVSLVPTKNTVEKMVAIYVAEKAVKIEGVNELPQNVVKFLNKFLKENSGDDKDGK